MTEFITHFTLLYTSLDVKIYKKLSNLVVLDQFKNTDPGVIATYVNEHEVKTTTEAAAQADDYMS